MRVLATHRVEECAVAVNGASARAVEQTRLAFDSVAATYGRSNAENPILCHMRGHARVALRRHVAAGLRILDLGCGPGCDDEWLAGAGYRVTAVDSSSCMVEEARRRIREARFSDRVEVLHLGIQELDRLPAASFDAAFSNLGPLNCVPDLDLVARRISQRLRRDGIFVGSVIGRVCPWELALYLSRGDWRRASVRFARRMVPVPLNGRTVWTRYYTLREFTRSFLKAGFSTVSARALGLFAPPPYMEAFAARHPRVIASLQWLEDSVGHLPCVRAWGDHFLVVMRKRGAG
jgi:SAM-dependent methyltransferase